MPLPIVPIALALAQFAPSLMRYFGAGESSVAVAEKVVGVAQVVTGASNPEEALAAMRENAAHQQQFNMAVLQMDQELEQAYIADRQNARARDVEFIKAGRNNTRADLMVVGAVVGLIACLLVLAFFRHQVPGEVVGIVSTIAGIFGACLRDAFQFEFGSSRNNQVKDDTINRMAARGAVQ